MYTVDAVEVADRVLQGEGPSVFEGLVRDLSDLPPEAYHELFGPRPMEHLIRQHGGMSEEELSPDHARAPLKVGKTAAELAKWYEGKKAADLVGKMPSSAVIDEVFLASPHRVADAASAAADAASASAAADAVVAPTAACRVAGGVTGGFGALAGLVEIHGAIHTLKTDHPAVSQAKILQLRLWKLAHQLEQQMQNDPALEQMIRNEIQRTRAFLKRLGNHQIVEGSAGVAGGSASFGGGTAMIVGAAIAGPVTLAVGTAVGTGAGVLQCAKQIGCSFRDYEIRKQFWEITRRITAIRLHANLITQQEADSCCRLTWHSTSSTGFYHQAWMSLTYTAADGLCVSLLSCDIGEWKNWYKGDFELEPGISNLVLSFDVRAGATVCAVDRNDRSMPWLTKPGRWFRPRCYQEFFQVPNPNGRTLDFELGGSWLSPFVRKATSRPHGAHGHAESMSGVAEEDVIW